MRVVVTGTSYGIGEAIAERFLSMGWQVYGIDTLPPSKKLADYSSFIPLEGNIADASSLQDISDVEILVNNAGVINSSRDIDVNLKGTMNVTAKYALNNPSICAVVNISDLCAELGTGYGEYVASKGGIEAYTRWTAKQLAKYGATCNALVLGGVVTASNDAIMDDSVSWKEIMALTPMKKWAKLDEVAQWVFFLTTLNKSCSGQCIVVDNLESLNGTYID